MLAAPRDRCARARFPTARTGRSSSTPSGPGGPSRRRSGVALVVSDGQVGPGAGLAEQLAPDLLGAEDAGQPPVLLLVGAVGQQGRPGEVHAGAVDRLGCLRAGVLHVEDRHLDRRRARGRRTRWASGCRPTGRRPGAPATRGPTRTPRRSSRTTGVGSTLASSQSRASRLEGQFVVAQRQVHRFLRSRFIAALRSCGPPPTSASPDRACPRPASGLRRVARPVPEP